ncbi:hypothetical protein KKF81_02985 [Candidatus Micrarchaeota archaeon]|nr:hypothetical protein [Candidatus Micrarchaeota archaeon]MBU1165887.1 hypothetical protein [Candidatus Micrarchaeota archaeon]MBU1886991.1 hypothetical protein [Candidatus Micrarchaeota archaeon]
MTSHKILLSLLLVIGLINALNVNDYLYPEEENATIIYKNFTIGTTQYSIVSVDGQDILLLKGGNAVTEQLEIENAVYSYYLKTHYPSDDEISELRALITRYNESRNDGFRWKGKEEYTCRDVIFVNGRVKAGKDPIFCRNENDSLLCNYSAILMFQYLSSISVPPVGYWDALLEPIRIFGFSSYGMDGILDKTVSDLDAAEADETKMYGALDYLHTNIPQIEEYHLALEDSLFTWNNKLIVDSKHWGLCPDINLNETILDQIENLSGSMLEKMGPFSNFDSISSGFYAVSLQRIEYAETEKLAEEYAKAYELLQNDGEEAVLLGNAAVERVANPDLQNDVFSLEVLHTGIPQDIESRNLESIEQDFAKYNALIINIKNRSFVDLNYYNNTKNAKNLANSLVLVLESKDLDPVSMNFLILMKNETGDLDAQFRNGLTVDELENLEIQYTGVAKEAQTLLNNEDNLPVTKALLLFRDSARKMNVGIASVAEKTDIVSTKEIPDNSLILGLFSGLVFVCLASMVTLIFLYITATNEFTIPRTGHIIAAAFVCSITLLLAFSVFIFLFLNKTSVDATLPEFISDFNSKNSASVVVDLRNVGYDDSIAMASCSTSLANSFVQNNKTWNIYTLTTDGCVQKTPSGETTGLTVDSCMEMADNESSVFMLSYSANNEPPKFSIIYENKAEIKANLDYYESCPLVALFNE